MARSRRGAENAVIFYTLLDAAKLAGVSPQAYLVAAVEYALTKNGEILLPAEFKSQLDAVRDPPITA
jgi:hypothetical protein